MQFIQHFGTTLAVILQVNRLLSCVCVELWLACQEHWVNELWGTWFELI